MRALWVVEQLIERDPAPVWYPSIQYGVDTSRDLGRQELPTTGKGR